jgi:hypothetical protein
MHWGSCVCTACTQCEMKRGFKVSRNLVSKIGLKKAKTILEPIVSLYPNWIWNSNFKYNCHLH